MNSEPVLFLSPLLAMPQQHGGCVYPDAVLKALHAAGMPIDYAWLAWPLRGRRMAMRDPLRAGYVRHGYVPGTGQLLGWRWRLLGEWRAAGPVSHEDDGPGEALPAREEQAFFRRLVQHTGIRRVLVDFATTLPVLDGLSAAERAQLRVAVLTHNVIHRRTSLYRERGLPLDFRPLTRAAETELLRRADVIVAIQEREAEDFRGMLPEREVVLVPMPVEPAPQPLAAIAGPCCLFVGGYSGHNLDGLRWFLAEVWPAVLAAVPEAEFVVAGTVGEAVPAGAARVRALGPVDALAPVYARAAVCVVPLRFGTGLKIKLVEAMAHGRAVVTTPAGAEGFAELEQGEVAVVAENGATMAAAISRLLMDGEARSAQITRQDSWLRRRLLRDQAVGPLIESFRNATPEPASRN